MYPDVTEQRLVQSCLDRDPAALNEFVARFEKRIWRYVVRMVGPDAAEDLTQDIFLRAISGLARFRGEASLSTWLYRIATNVCRDHLKRRRWRSLWQPLHDTLKGTGYGVQKLDYIDTSETRQLIKSVLARMPIKQREVVVLRDIEGFSYEEIASITGCAVGTVKSRLYYGRLFLAKELEASGLKF